MTILHYGLCLLVLSLAVQQIRTFIAESDDDIDYISERIAWWYVLIKWALLLKCYRKPERKAYAAAMLIVLKQQHKNSKGE